MLSTARKSIKNRPKISLESEIVSKSLSKSISEGFRVDFWVPNGRGFAVRWPGFCCPDASWERSRAQTGLQRPSGPHLGPFWKHFGSIFNQILVNFGQNFDHIFKENHASISILRLYLSCTPPFLSTHFVVGVGGMAYASSFFS